MRRFIRMWGVSAAAWVGVLVIAGAAIAGGGVATTEDPVLTVSPESVLTGKELDSGEEFEMSVHLQGAPDTVYTFSVIYEGTAVGTCADVPPTLETNAEGKASWECVFTTVANTGTESLSGGVAFLVTSPTGGAAKAEASLSVRVQEVEDDPVPEPAPDVVPKDAASEENHGQCVSWWGHEAKSEGLKGRWYGAFTSSIARDKEAVAPKTARDGDPGAKCDFANELQEWLKKQEDAAAAREAARSERQRKPKTAKGDDAT